MGGLPKLFLVLARACNVLHELNWPLRTSAGRMDCSLQLRPTLSLCELAPAARMDQGSCARPSPPREACFVTGCKRFRQEAPSAALRHQAGEVQMSASAQSSPQWPCGIH